MHEQKAEHGVNFTRLYAHFGTSRQAYYQSLKRAEAETAMMKEISTLVKAYRQHDDRRAGSRSLYYNLDIKRHYNIGVTKFEALMYQYGLTLAPLNMRMVTTTSSLQSWNYGNLIKGLVINGINQVVVGDITYIHIGKEVFYLFCLTDIYSGRIVGHHLGRRMRAHEAYLVFQQWIALRKEAVKGCIHHTDGGKQYFSALYLGALKDHYIEISRAENCLENGYAEQKNAFLKHHLIPTIALQQIAYFIEQLALKIITYNHDRKQQRLGWLSPVEFEKQMEHRTEKKTMRLADFDQK